MDPGNWVPEVYGFKGIVYFIVLYYHIWKNSISVNYKGAQM